MNTYTAFCQDKSGTGTIWIDTVFTVEPDIELAKIAAAKACAEAWEYPLEAIHVLGIAEGDVTIHYWQDIIED